MYTKKSFHRWWIWLVYLILFLISIPWYFPKSGKPRIWLGLPHWVVISLTATIAIACFTVFVLHRYFPEEEFSINILDREGEQP